MSGKFDPYERKEGDYSGAYLILGVLGLAAFMGLMAWLAS